MWGGEVDHLVMWVRVVLEVQASFQIQQESLFYQSQSIMLATDHEVSGGLQWNIFLIDSLRKGHCINLTTS